MFHVYRLRPGCRIARQQGVFALVSSRLGDVYVRPPVKSRLVAVREV